MVATSKLACSPDPVVEGPVVGGEDDPEALDERLRVEHPRFRAAEGAIAPDHRLHPHDVDGGRRPIEFGGEVGDDHGEERLAEA